MAKQQTTQTQPVSAIPPKTVLIGTPCLDGKLDAWYVNSLVDTIRVAMANNVFIKPIFLAYESILPMARNELFRVAFDNKFDHLIFIDSDVAWEPLALMEIIHTDKPVVGLPYPLKNENPGNFNISLGDPNSLVQDEKTGYIKVINHGTGFLKIDRVVIEALWNTNVSLQFRDKELKYICEYQGQYTAFMGEDVVLCNKIRELGFDIWVNPKTTCMHIGNKIYTGNFQSYLDTVKQQVALSNDLSATNTTNSTVDLFDA
jgi:hypothetical protein